MCINAFSNGPKPSNSVPCSGLNTEIMNWLNIYFSFFLPLTLAKLRIFNLGNVKLSSILRFSGEGVIRDLKIEDGLPSHGNLRCFLPKTFD